jgi:hypothetical protein
LLFSCFFGFGCGFYFILDLKLAAFTLLLCLFGFGSCSGFGSLCMFGNSFDFTVAFV